MFAMTDGRRLFYVGLALAYRRRPEIHKRLMILATIALVFAAITRLVPVESPATGSLP